MLRLIVRDGVRAARGATTVAITVEDAEAGVVDVPPMGPPHVTGSFPPKNTDPLPAQSCRLSLPIDDPWRLSVPRRLGGRVAEAEADQPATAATAVAAAPEALVGVPNMKEDELRRGESNDERLSQETRRALN